MEPGKYWGRKEMEVKRINGIYTSWQKQNITKTNTVTSDNVFIALTIRVT